MNPHDFMMHTMALQERDRQIAEDNLKVLYSWERDAKLARRDCCVVELQPQIRENIAGTKNLCAPGSVRWGVYKPDGC